MNSRKHTVVLHRRCNMLSDATKCRRIYKNSLGFSIVGGIDSPRGPMGIFVKSVFDDGIAAQTGLVHKGDEVLSVNGIELHGKTHSQALQIFRHFSKSDVTLCIRRKNSTDDFASPYPATEQLQQKSWALSNDEQSGSCLRQPV
uniref:PDZ domain-containing protein n=1 Tax=Syphacia muris TaxID=451379 RepID=A0A0N5AK18_9BILA